jgi:adenosylcobalamin-dependent ribonucleoside-triphosphate reductase
MGQAVAERTILRKIPINPSTLKVSQNDPNHDHIKLYCETHGKEFVVDETNQAEPVGVRWESWDEVAKRVAQGNVSLYPEEGEEELLAKHIANANILMSGRHLQHGDINQSKRNMEVFTNCSTASTSFMLFYLLLNGSGVGRVYDDDMMLVDWNYMPNVRCVLDESHADFNFQEHESVRDARHKYGRGQDVIWFEVEDSREGWAKALEKLETMTYQKAFKDSILILDFSKVRPQGAAIGGMQNRPSSGPVPLMMAIHKLVTLKGAGLPRWMQAMYVDHYLAEPVLVGGARRAARMAVKYWKDKTVLDFIEIKRPIEFYNKSAKQVENLREKANFMSFLWSSNNSIGVDADFWHRLELTPDDPHYNSKLTQHARAVFEAVTRCSYGDGTGEPGFINLDKLVEKREGVEKHENGNYVGSARYSVDLETRILLAGLAARANKKDYCMIVNPCGEIVLYLNGAFCVIADVVAYHAQNLSEAEDAFKVAARALIRVNSMDSVYNKEVKRTNRIGVGQTGVHEFAWKYFRVGFRDLVNPDFKGFLSKMENYGLSEGYLEVVEDMLRKDILSDRERAAAFWEVQGQFSRSTIRHAAFYSAKLGMNVPHTVMTIKPAGTTSKLFGLSEGWHLPALAHYLRWVQFRHDDPNIQEYEQNGYPVRHNLKTYQGTSIVGFPTAPAISSLDIGDKLVLAGDATPEEQYEWLRLGEFFWIEGGTVIEYVENEDPRHGEVRFGNQISYTLKYKPEEVSLSKFSEIIRKQQSTIRCASVMPQEEGQSYEYLPEEPVTKVRFEEILREINNVQVEDIGKEHIDCAGGACPVDFNTRGK